MDFTENNVLLYFTDGLYFYLFCQFVFTRTFMVVATDYAFI